MLYTKESWDLVLRFWLTIKHWFLCFLRLSHDFCSGIQFFLLIALGFLLTTSFNFRHSGLDIIESKSNAGYNFVGKHLISLLPYLATATRRLRTCLLRILFALFPRTVFSFYAFLKQQTNRSCACWHCPTSVSSFPAHPVPAPCLMKNAVWINSTACESPKALQSWKLETGTTVQHAVPSTLGSPIYADFLRILNVAMCRMAYLVCFVTKISNLENLELFLVTIWSFKYQRRMTSSSSINVKFVNRI